MDQLGNVAADGGLLRGGRGGIAQDRDRGIRLVDAGDPLRGNPQRTSGVGERRVDLQNDPVRRGRTFRLPLEAGGDAVGAIRLHRRDRSGKHSGALAAAHHFPHFVKVHGMVCHLFAQMGGPGIPVIEGGVPLQLSAVLRQDRVILQNIGRPQGQVPDLLRCMVKLRQEALGLMEVSADGDGVSGAQEGKGILYSLVVHARSLLLIRLDGMLLTRLFRRGSGGAWHSP